MKNDLTKLLPENGSLWLATKKALHYKVPITLFMRPDVVLASSGIDKTKLFKNHLAEIFTPHANIQIPEHVDVVKSFLDIPLPLHLPVKHFTSNEIKIIIQKYCLKNSPGYNLITVEVAQYLPKKAVVLLILLIFNVTLRLSNFPILWKFASIILIPKPNKPFITPSSFCLISLLPFFAKIQEKLKLKKMLPYISSNKILPDTQFGFHASHFTTHQLHRLVNAISYTLEENKYYSSVFLEISQAFDSNLARRITI